MWEWALSGPETSPEQGIQELGCCSAREWITEPGFPKGVEEETRIWSGISPETPY